MIMIVNNGSNKLNYLLVGYYFEVYSVFFNFYIYFFGVNYLYWFLYFWYYLMLEFIELTVKIIKIIKLNMIMIVNNGSNKLDYLLVGYYLIIFFFLIFWIKLNISAGNIWWKQREKIKRKKMRIRFNNLFFFNF